MDRIAPHRSKTCALNASTLVPAAAKTVRMSWTCTGLDMMDEQDLPCSVVPGLVALPAKSEGGVEFLHELLPARVAEVVAAGISCQTLLVAVESPNILTQLISMVGTYGHVIGTSASVWQNSD